MPAKPKKPKGQHLALRRFVGDKSVVLIKLENDHDIEGIPRVKIVVNDGDGEAIRKWISDTGDPNTKILDLGGPGKGLKAEVKCVQGDVKNGPTIVMEVDEGAISVEITIINSANGGPAQESAPDEEDAVLFP